MYWKIFISDFVTEAVFALRYMKWRELAAWG